MEVWWAGDDADPRPKPLFSGLGCTSSGITSDLETMSDEDVLGPSSFPPQSKRELRQIESDTL